jgi:NAD(P)-dependent dehydrogenase (short-subunit alcohol dehydrogenase family)
MLDGKVAIVTGGGRGIGREHCLELARHGAAVVVMDPGVGVHGEASAEAPADEVVNEIEKLGSRALADKGSVTSWSDCQVVVQRAVEEFGRLDAVINNAGIVRDKMITSTSEEDFDLTIATHLKGTYAMTKHACDHWRAIGKAGGTNTGRIINTTSGAGLKGNLGQSAYGAAKAGIAGLTVITALEMARYDVTANAISPMAITRMSGTIPGLSDKPIEHDSPYHPGSSSPLVAWLASDHSAWVSGQVLRVEDNTLIHMRGWDNGPGGFAGKDGGRLQAEDLILGARQLFGAHPAGLSLSGIKGS